MSSVTDIIVANPHAPPSTSFIIEKSIHRAHAFVIPVLPSWRGIRLLGIQLVNIPKDSGVKKRKRANSVPKRGAQS